LLGAGPVEVPLQTGVGADGVIFLRLVIDPTNPVQPDAAVLSLREVGK
jgi:hypothetical protein